MADAASFPRRVLLAVTGMSPQVVTETLFALVTERGFVPTEIQLITTALGKNRAMRDLLDARDGRFFAFCEEFGLVGQIRFDADCITVITDESGVALSDIRSPGDNALAADAIAGVVQRFCQDANCALHVSIAGGRKTMGFFVGYALSLFARAQDQLSHVLVSEPFEHNRDFFYPSRVRRELVLADGRKVDTLTAQIILADMPLVRLRAGLPKPLLVGEVSYSAAVQAAQQQIDAVPMLMFDFRRRLLLCGGVEVRLQPLWFAFMYWLAGLYLRGDGVRLGDLAQGRDFLQVYRRVVGAGTGRHEQVAQSLESEEDFQARFPEFRTRINAALRAQLGEVRAGPYLVVSLGRRTQSRYGLQLPREMIQLGEE